MTTPHKPRILIVSLVVPATNRGGGCLALHRHFQQRHDFDCAVAGPYLVGVRAIRKIPLRNHPVIHRLLRSDKLRRIGHNLACLANWLWLPPRLLRYARLWRPDAIFCVPDNHVMGWAWLLSRRLRIPLIVNFQDLFPLMDYQIRDPQRPWPWVRRFLINRYRFLNRHADLALYTSEGMQEWLASCPSPNGHILYPIGSDCPLAASPSSPPDSPLTLIYTGNCYGPYGRMLRALAHHLRSQSAIRLVIHPSGIDWPEPELQDWRRRGVVRASLPFTELRQQMQQADLLLTTMGFDPPDKIFAQTSFTTKWLDYAPLGKPVVVWAPNYATASRFALAHQAALIINNPDPAALVEAVLKLARDPAQWRSLAEASLRLAAGPLHPGAIHEVLLHRIRALCT